MAILSDPGLAATRPKVLLICDRDPEIARWARLLSGTAIELVPARTLDHVLDTWRELIPDLVLIDVDESHPDGIEICWELRQESVLPLLVAFERPDEPLMLEAYHAGADDCLVKPLNRDLVATKLKVWLRRSWTVPAEALAELRAGAVNLDPVRRMVVFESGRLVRLTNMELRLLTLLMSHPGRAVSPGGIVRRLWGYSGETEGSVMLKNVVYRLRKKIEPDPANPIYLVTEPGQGYRFRGG